MSTSKSNSKNNVTSKNIDSKMSAIDKNEKILKGEKTLRKDFLAETLLNETETKLSTQNELNSAINKAKAQANANKFLLSQLDKTLFVSVSGQSKENIYKNDIFKSCITDKEKKTLRRQLRNIADSFISSFIYYDANKQTAKIADLKVQFDLYYKSHYCLNDYSVNSFVSNNTDQSKKDNVKKMFDIIAKIK